MGASGKGCRLGRCYEAYLSSSCSSIGWFFAFQSPLYAAALYLWIAYFRPESWAWSDVFATLNLSYIAGVFLVVRTMMSPVRFRLDLRNGLLIAFLAHSLLCSLLAPNVDYSLGHLAGVRQDDHRQLPAERPDYDRIGFSTDPHGDRAVVGLRGRQARLGATGAQPGRARTTIACRFSATTTWSRSAWHAVADGRVRSARPRPAGNGALSSFSASASSTARSAPTREAACWQSAPSGHCPSGDRRTNCEPHSPLPSPWPSSCRCCRKRIGTACPPSPPRVTSAIESQTGRLHFWQTAVTMANDRPLIGVGHRGYEPNYNRYDSTAGFHGTNRAVHSAWFGIFAEGGYPGMGLFLAIFGSSWWACRRIRRLARNGEVTESLGRYAIGMESALVAFAVGGSFVSFQYNEMLWHFFALTMALEHVAVTQAAEARRRVSAEATPPSPETVPLREPDFVWD